MPEGPAWCKTSNSTKIPPVSMITTTGIQVFIPKTSEYHLVLVRVSQNTVYKNNKNNRVFQLKPSFRIIFGQILAMNTTNIAITTSPV